MLGGKEQNSGLLFMFCIELLFAFTSFVLSPEWIRVSHIEIGVWVLNNRIIELD